jgi:hypothetical protein
MCSWENARTHRLSSTRGTHSCQPPTNNRDEAKQLTVYFLETWSSESDIEKHRRDAIENPAFVGRFDKAVKILDSPTSDPTAMDRLGF